MARQVVREAKKSVPQFITAGSTIAALLTDKETDEACTAFSNALEWASTNGMSIIAIIPGPHTTMSPTPKFGNFRVGTTRATVAMSLDEGDIVHNVSLMGDKVIKLLHKVGYCTETSYFPHNAGWTILEMATPL
ncbi:hypothetical protein GGI23_000300 [Coemansia sp. RSA 2559]|nr:hypothetical protein GGI23_000300 [Coemansia sp. RSA 2559]